jgi:Arc/MetJ-type ribon-helix-helix transcriptional regulator
MKRTTVSLPEDLTLALAREAKRRRVSISEVARVALAKDLALGQDDAPRRLPIAGLGRSGHKTTARNMESLLEQEWRDVAGDR